ncbi:ATP-binding protein [Phycisphaerales bacterium AB-hyl4]|uniref:ATP-binding protein n=1 Tax=Natronomicrosphaera hydrolytica TaxID=3242702 RepID=A0ABV4U8M5_9BACT
MRAIVTGQVGMDKKHYLEQVVQTAADHGERLSLLNVGDLMYDEARDVRPGRILDLPLSRLHALRRAAFKDVINHANQHPQEHVVVNTHATFRWRHGLFAAFDFDQIRALKPDTLICLVDNIEVVHQRLHDEHIVDATLKDLMVWREEEIMATELLAQALGIADRFYILSRGRDSETLQTCFRLICRPDMRRVYPSFPMTHVVGMPDVLAEIDTFRAELAKQFIAFDPGDVDEKLLLENALQAARDGRDFVEATMSTPDGPRRLKVSAKQILDIAGDIDGQIYMRDFKLIDQSDMIVSYIPELPGGIPGLSSGVERELQHAFEHGKEVYVVWKPKKSPSPFITETATNVFNTTADAMTYFEQRGMFYQANLFGQ